VDLRGRLSNPDVQDVVGHAAQAVACGKVERGSTASPPPAGRRWRLVDRLSEQIIRDLLRDRSAGTSQRKLAERYGISVSTVKRLSKREHLR
jgi:DNA invertase Pin-like site-specific DNA recombinase